MSVAGSLAVAGTLTLVACSGGEAAPKKIIRIVRTADGGTQAVDETGKVVEVPDDMTAAEVDSGDQKILVQLDAGALEAAPPAEAGVCTLPELGAPVVVNPSFMQVDKKKGILAPVVDPGVGLDKMKGNYQIDKAVVWLPDALRGLVSPEKSTGSVNTAAIFDGVRHRFSIHANIIVDSKKGPQPQKIDVDSYGTHTLESGIIHVATACDDKPIPSTLVSFIDNGDRVMFLLATKTNRGDVIVALEAPRVVR